jgi:hypothetical protein
MPTDHPLAFAPRRGRPAGATLRRRGLATALALTLLVGCAGLDGARRLSRGQDEATVVATLGPPTGRYPLPGGGQRLEFARGPLGYETWMVDLDAAGRTVAFEQVLTARRFAEVRRGMTGDELLRLLGRPAERQRQYLDRVTWYWRHSPYDCLWFGVTMSPQGRALDTGGNVPDPRCDVSQ